MSRGAIAPMAYKFVAGIIPPPRNRRHARPSLPPKDGRFNFTEHCGKDESLLLRFGATRLSRGLAPHHPSLRLRVTRGRPFQLYGTLRQGRIFAFALRRYAPLAPACRPSPFAKASRDKRTAVSIFRTGDSRREPPEAWGEGWLRVSISGDTARTGPRRPLPFARAHSLGQGRRGPATTAILGNN